MQIQFSFLSKHCHSEWAKDFFAALATQLGWLAANPITYLVFLVVLMVDSCLIGLHLAFRYATMDGTELPNWFNLSQDGSLGELFEYLMTGLGAVCLAVMARRHRSGALGTVAGLMAYITMDNSLQLHEDLGVRLGRLLPAIGPLGGDGLGELVVLTLFGMAVLAALLVTVRRELTPATAGGGMVLALIVLAAGFGIGIDALHAIVPTEKLLIEVIISGIEDGGELIFFSLAGALSICLMVTDRIDRRVARSAI